MTNEFSFARISVDLMSLDQENLIRVYEQQLLLNHLLERNPTWLSQIIAILNNLEVKNAQ